MSRVLALVEGQTEQAFVKQVLAPELSARGVFLTAALIGKPGRKGGIRPYEIVRGDILRLLKQDRQQFCTTMLDYYGLPAGWPGKAGGRGSPSSLAEHIEQAMRDDVAAAMGEGFAPTRFIPYIQMHEFEALLFSDPGVLAGVLDVPGLAETLQGIIAQCGEPERIDDSPEGAPSKRISQHSRRYNKVVHGTIAAQRIGLTRMRDRCPHFAAWLGGLGHLGSAAPG
jgi:hypothetical protein